jgi:polysaccharide export outer membrane protein
MKLGRMHLVGLLVLAVLGLGPAPARAEEYTLGSEDVIAVSVWMHPELERTLTIGSEGSITYSPIGEVKAAGLTTKQLADRIGDRLSTYLRQSVTVTVTVSLYMSRSVFVSGAVAKPGRYGFENIPGLVDVLSQAGGALPGADLSAVQVIRREGEARRTLMADVASALRDGVGVSLPPLKPGDTVVVPGGMAAIGAAPGEGAGVIGEVTRPGLYPVGAGQELWTLLAAAGGPTPRGDLASVRVLTRSGEGQAVVTLNLRDGLRHGTGSSFVVRAGDVVVISPTGTSALGQTWTGFTALLAVSRDLLSLVVLRDVYRGTGR